MLRDDARICSLFDRAVGHLILARFGRHPAQARRNLYRRAAGCLMEAARMLLEEVQAEESLETAERMLERSYPEERR